MGTETDPKDFISSVLAIAKETYGSGAIYIPRYRAVKLVCLVADDLGFDGVSRGWYKFGLYSFLVDKIVKKTFKTARNLSDVQITQVCVNDDLKFKIRKTILGLQKNFLQSRENFGDWIHYEIAPAPYNIFYKYHYAFSESMRLHNNQSAQMVLSGHPRNVVGNIITKYNTCLKHVPEERQDLFFDFTDIVEDLLIVAKTRGIKFSNLSEYLLSLDRLYEDKIYPGLTPFEKTVKGDSGDIEIEIFCKNISNYCKFSSGELDRIRTTIAQAGLEPSFEEYDIDILSAVEGMPEERRNAIGNLFTAPTRPSL